jgi:hypothetical protein
MIELILAVRMAMHKHRQITFGKSGLAVGDRIKRDAGFGDDLLAIASCDLRMFGDAFCFKAVVGHA